MIAPSKNVFQKKKIYLTPQYLNIAFSKNVFQNCCKLSIKNKNTRYVNYSIFKKLYIAHLK